jgi:hypothetical protein
MTDEQMQELLLTYVDVILKCENGIKETYRLESIPYLNKDRIPKSNKLLVEGVQLEYNFHGSGCTFIYGSIELDYDIYIDREDYIVVSLWGFTIFVNSFLKPETNYSELQILEWLEILNAQKKINKIYEEYFVYEVSLSWYNAYKRGSNVSK